VRVQGGCSGGLEDAAARQVERERERVLERAMNFGGGHVTGFHDSRLVLV
jgi:hypothetical protein